MPCSTPDTAAARELAHAHPRMTAPARRSCPASSPAGHACGAGSKHASLEGHGLLGWLAGKAGPLPRYRGKGGPPESSPPPVCPAIPSISTSRSETDIPCSGSTRRRPMPPPRLLGMGAGGANAAQLCTTHSSRGKLSRAESRRVSPFRHTNPFFWLALAPRTDGCLTLNAR